MTDPWIDTTFWPRSFGPPANFRGPWQTSGGLYVIVENDLHLNDALPDYCAVYLSTDNGLTWTEMDSANHPAAHVGGSYFDGQNIHVFYSLEAFTADFTLHYIVFNTATNTWGIDTAGGPTFNAGSPGCFVTAYKLPVLTFRIVYNILVAGKTQVATATYQAGWGAPIQLSALGGGDNTDSSAVVGALLDASKTLRVFWRTFPFGGPTPKIYNRSIDDTNTIGIEQIVWDISTGVNVQCGPGNVVEFGGKICICFGSTNGASALRPSLFRAPSNALDLVFGALEVVSTTHNTAFSTTSQVSQFLVSIGGTLYLFWCTLAPATMNSIYLNSNSGSGWAVADTLYFTDAPSNATHDFFEELSIARLTAVWGVLHDRIWPGNNTDSAAAFIVDAVPVIPVTPVYPGGNFLTDQNIFPVVLPDPKLCKTKRQLQAKNFQPNFTVCK